MFSDEKRALIVDAQLSITHTSGEVKITSLSSDHLQVSFSSAETFREFVRPFHKNLRPDQINLVQEIVDHHELTVTLMIEEKEMVKFAPGISPDLSITGLLPQLLMLLMGR